MAAPSDLIVVPPGSSGYPTTVIDGVDHLGSEQREEKILVQGRLWRLVDIVRHRKHGGGVLVAGRGLAAVLSAVTRSNSRAERFGRICG